MYRGGYRTYRPATRFFYGAPYAWYGSGLYGGFYYGNGFGWGYPYRWGSPYAYGYGPYWGGTYGYGAYGYGYPGAGYGYAPYGAIGARATGGVRIDLDQRDAQVTVDGYYAGVVDDFDGSFQQLNLEPGAHRIEITRDGFEPVSFDVNIEPGRVVTYRTRLRPLGP